MHLRGIVEALKATVEARLAIEFTCRMGKKIGNQKRELFWIFFVGITYDIIVQV